MKAPLLALALLIAPVTLNAQNIALDSAETEMVLRDSENAHKVAQAALDAVGCVLAALAETAQWSPQACMARLQPLLDDYGQEHRFLHPAIIKMLKEKRAKVSS